ncbi:hypothetical protein [uncultured Tateyamaria sp.]|nr:hypothetical protein [uncultured Tateyamaria sp.]
MKQPTSGGSWVRDPETKRLTKPKPPVAKPPKTKPKEGTEK